MIERLAIKLRCLPDGQFQDAFEVDAKGRFLELDLAGLDLPVGSLLEIERGSMLCLGQLQRKEGSAAVVHVEHSLDRTKLKPIQEIWG
jgi:hypothetical protein